MQLTQRLKPIAPYPALTLRLAAVIVVDAALLWLILQLIGDDNLPLAVALAFVLVIFSLCFTLERLKAWRWLCIGLCLATLFVLYPITYTFVLSTTNNGSGHILSKARAIETFEAQQYVPEGAATYRWTAYQSPDGTSYLLWLQAEDGTTQVARIGADITAAVPGAGSVGAPDEDGIPSNIDGYRRLAKREVVPLIDALSHIEFGAPPDAVEITSLNAASVTAQRYVYDAAQDALIDQVTGVLYRPVRGTFVSDAGDELTPGFTVGIGLDNFNRFFNSAALRGPLTTIIAWNFGYAFLSVVCSFALGLFIALLFNDLPGKRVIRTLLIIPYPIPALVSILIWRNLLNPDFGALVNLFETIFGSSPGWLTDPTATRAAIVVINMWLSYPYFYIVSSGALQAIPTDFLDAAAVDGANVWQRFTRITFPLLLRIVSPLLVASFAFNFNNFNLIYIFNSGNPPIAGSPIPAGHTDILISFVYKLAFTNSTREYGFASAISIVLFAFVAVITWIQFRYTRLLEDRN